MKERIIGLLNFLKKHTQSALAVLPLSALFIGVIAGTYPGYKVFEYIWKDANFCMTCHVHDYANSTWEASSHGKYTTCHDCHHQPLHVYLMEPIILLLHQPKFPKDLKNTPHIVEGLCESCHISTHTDYSTITGPLGPEQVKKVIKVDNLHLHKKHLGKMTKLKIPANYKLLEEKLPYGHIKQAENFLQGEERPIECTDCHGGAPNRGHNFTATDASCIHCHSNKHHKDTREKFKEVHSCRSCHFLDFMVQAKPEEKESL